ncbi:MAG: XkdF-like putative serine protease domain-containing protein [Ruminococcus flavefaciens]|nr:XkdF-like putative serine protease domain-containing protein [Ruminococcus flavefaciens]
MRKVERAYEITDAKIQFVSLVDRAANKRPFLLKKADDGKAAFTTYGRIIKADTENHYVTGIVYEPMTEDSHGNFMTEEEITKAAYWFAKNGDKVDLQHSFEPLDGAAVVENWIAKADFEIDGEAVQKGTWLMTVEVTDESTWEGIEKGDITGFSMGGLGNYSEEDVELDNVSKQETSEKKGLLKQLAKMLGLNVVEKGATAELYAERSRGQLFWEAFYALKDTLYAYSPYEDKWVYETDEDKVRECLEDFNQIVTSLLTGKESITKAIQDRPVEKAGKKLSSKNKETLQGIYDSLGTFLAEFEEKKDEPEKIDTVDNSKEVEKEEKEVTKQEVEQIVEKSVAAAIEKAMKVAAADTKDEETKDDATKDDSKDKEKEDEKLDEETVAKMVEAAVAKALTPQPQEQVTAEQVADMVTKAVEKAVAPVLRSKGVPNNLNGSSVEKDAGEHYLHGIL